MRKNIEIVGVLLGILFAGGVALAQDNAASSPPQGEAAITFPIPELGNCTSKDACKLYCSDQGHIEACISFGESHGLMRSDEAAHARTFATMKGPGGCMGEACRVYCDNPDHVDECLAFAQSHGLVRAEDVKILKVIRENGGPGGCKSETECRTYCSDSAHKDDCQKFAQDNGLTQGPPPQGTGTNELGQQNQSGPQGGNPKIQQILASAGGPGGCKTEDACRAYCNDQTHMSECLQFGKDNGLMNPDEYDRAKKFVNQTGPGGCKGQECRAYCDNGANAEECLKFGEEKGLITKDEAGQARKLAGKPGPGGCRGEECKTYCQDQSHHDECTSFAVQNGFMTQAEADHMQQNMQNITGPGGCIGQTCRTYCEDAAHRDECVSFAKEHGRMGPPPDQNQNSINNGNPPPSGAGQFSPPSSGDQGNMGPGGCKTQAECQTFCTNNPDQCKGNPNMGNQPSPQGGSRPGQYQNMDQQTQSNLGPDQQHAMYQQRSGQGEPLNPPVNMTPEQQQRYDTYRQSQQGQQNQTTSAPPKEYQPPPSQSTSGQLPPNMTAEQQQTYQQYQQTGVAPSPTSQPPPSVTPAQQQMYQQYQQTSQPPPSSYTPPPSSYPTPPSGSYPSPGSYSPPPSSSPPPSGSYSAPPPSMSAPPPSSAPTSGARPSNLVAAVFYIFSQLLHGF